MQIWNNSFVVNVRARIARFRRQWDPFYQAKWRRIREAQLAANIPYEAGEKWAPQVMSLEETMRYVIDRRCSISRFGDGEMALVCGRSMLFESANQVMQNRLVEILGCPLENCLLAIPTIFGSLAAYKKRDHVFWREVALWAREKMYAALAEGYKANPPLLPLGDPYISRPYMNLEDASLAPKVFALWKELFKDKNILIAEGRFSRLGVGNDLLDGAKSVRRIWCPPKGAFAKYDEILAAIKRNATKNDLIIMALGGTATILAYDLAKAGYWAVDTGHLDVEYMWMKMGATEKVAIPGRYVSEVRGGQEQIEIEDELRANNVIEEIK